MRALFLTLYPATAASTRYRVAQFLPSLEEQGIECDTASAISEDFDLDWRERPRRPWRYHLHEGRRRLAHVLNARRFDVVVVQKALTTVYFSGLDRLLRARTRHVVLDIDDAMHLGPSLKPSGMARWLTDAGQVSRLMCEADLVLAGNRWLVEEAERLDGTTEYFPTVIDTERFRPVEGTPETFTIGWMGGPSTTPAVAELEPVLRNFPQVQLVGADASRLGALSDRAIEWRLDDEVNRIQNFSVGLMPLPRDEWTRGKCGLKALQYMACGVPPIVTPYGAALEIVEDGENGLLADTPKEWRAAIERLRDNPGERERLGTAARRTVEERYALSDWTPRMAELLKQVAE